MSKTSNSYWISKQKDALPDFIIGGAMKSGTTTLHAILNAHPDIKIATDELGFFDIDSIVQHGDFNFYNQKTKTWTTQSLINNPKLIWDWYYSKFTNPNKINGEDSTTYLASRLAPQRIAMQEKPIKLIFILRHPTQRTISNYHHSLKSGRAIYSLEDTLKYAPLSIIRRSLYKEQLENYYKHIPFERIKVVLFEDLIEDPRNCIKELCDFIGVDPQKISDESYTLHSNKTNGPKYIKLQLLRNRILRYYGNYRYSNFLPQQPEIQKTIPLWHKIIHKLHKKINPLKSKYKMMPEQGTIDFLDAFFEEEMLGIDALVQKDIYSRWFKNKNK